MFNVNARKDEVSSVARAQQRQQDQKVANHHNGDPLRPLQHHLNPPDPLPEYCLNQIQHYPKPPSTWQPVSLAQAVYRLSPAH